MKFQQMAMGARFEFDGVEFVKTGPLTANSAGGVQRVIPRFAMLKPLDAPTAEAAGKPKTPDPERFLPAFESFYRIADNLLRADATMPLEARLAALQQARQRWFDEIAG